MTVREAMAALEAAGSENIRAIYMRHGAGENQFGVKFGDLGKIRKQIGTDAKLALELWDTGNSDARMLACMIADPRTMPQDALDAWVESIGYYALADVFVQQVAGKSPHREALMMRWMRGLSRSGTTVSRRYWCSRWRESHRMATHSPCGGLNRLASMLRKQVGRCWRRSR